MRSDDNASLPALDASTPGALLRHRLQAEYRRLAELERTRRGLDGDLEQCRRRIAALEALTDHSEAQR